MGHHINEKGEFQSDKYPDLAPDKIVLSFKDEHARAALEVYAARVFRTDPELTEDIRERIDTITTS